MSDIPTDTCSASARISNQHTLPVIEVPPGNGRQLRLADDFRLLLHNDSLGYRRIHGWIRFRKDQ